MADQFPQHDPTLAFLIPAVLEAIDDFVGDAGHVWRVRQYAVLLGKQLLRDGSFNCQIDDDFLRSLWRAAPLHDIGKVCVDRRILSKQGRLTDEEFEAVKQHVRIGSQLVLRAAEISGDVSLLSVVNDVVLYHHERYDGTGYCAGLRGASIPLAARIVAVADAFDALTSKRSYKQAVSPADARQIIEVESGKHFDPFVVAAFLAQYTEFANIVAARASREPSTESWNADVSHA